MSHGTLRPLNQDETPLYGPKGILVCGLDEEKAMRAEYLFKALSWEEVPLSFAGPADIATPVIDLFESQPDNRNPMGGVAVIMGGITGKQLHQLMAAWRAVKLPAPLWATLQKTSAIWPLATLLKHLALEQQEMRNTQNPAKS
ncbi:MAG: DUF3783 domain-containing protein [Desulfobacterales bacterium]|nr:DUF3783 domain-containing protein [Desulfobacterales bacterium]